MQFHCLGSRLLNIYIYTYVGLRCFFFNLACPSKLIPTSMHHAAPRVLFQQRSQTAPLSKSSSIACTANKLQKSVNQLPAKPKRSNAQNIDYVMGAGGVMVLRLLKWDRSQHGAPSGYVLGIVKLGYYWEGIGRC